MNIEGMGPALIEQIVENDLVQDYGDLFALTFDELVELERMAKTSVQNLLESIERSKSNILDRLIFGLGIRHVGRPHCCTEWPVLDPSVVIQDQPGLCAQETPQRIHTRLRRGIARKTSCSKGLC